MPHAPSIYAIIRFNTWIDDFGGQKAGLPPGALSALHGAGCGLQARAMGLRNNGLHVQDAWRKIGAAATAGAPDEPAEIRSIMQQIGVELLNLRITIASILEDAAGLHRQIREAESMIAAQAEKDRRKLDELMQDVQEATGMLEDKKTSLAAAKSALADHAGATDSEAIDRANSDVAQAYSKLNVLFSLRDQQSRRIAEQAACTRLLQDLGGMDEALADLQERLDTTLTTMANAHAAEPKILGATPEPVANYYFKAADRELDRLFDWMDTFFAPAESVDAGMDHLWDALPGHYEYHPADAAGKSDAHVVTITPLSDQRVVWTNKGGMSWALSRTANPRVLAIGPDCPFFDSYKEATIYGEGGAVAGIWGPGAGLYKKA